VVLIGLGVLLLVVTAVFAFGPLRTRDGIATGTVERGDFERWVTADGALRAASATPVRVPPETPGSLRIAWIAPEGTYLAAGEVAVAFDPTEVENTLADRRADLESNDLKLGKQRNDAETRIENLERDAELARRDLEHSREFASQDELIYSRAEILESRIDEELAEARLERAQGDAQREEVLSRADRDILAIERRRIAVEVERAESTLGSLEVRAPHDGYFVYQRDWRGQEPRVGETVFRGFPLGELPRLGEMEVEAYVLEADAGDLTPGDRARVHLEAHPGKVYDAEVVHVDAIAKPRHPASPVQYFAVRLKLAESDARVMKPGQRVRTEILLESQEDALTVPRQAVFEREGESVVYLRRGGDFESVPVKTGAAGRGRVVVTGDLEPGASIALADPTAPEPGEGDEEEAEESEAPPAQAPPAVRVIRGGRG
jgi:multidrug resistance efflux pump